MTKTIRKRSSRKPRNNGFTLIEIMIVVITLGVISSLALLSYSKVLERGHCANAKENLRRIHAAVQIYYLKHGNSGIPGLSSAETINNTFNINIVDPYFNYSTYYDPGHGPILSQGHATRLNGPTYMCSAPFGIPINDTNPSCTSADYCDSVGP